MYGWRPSEFSNDISGPCLNWLLEGAMNPIVDLDKVLGEGVVFQPYAVPSDFLSFERVSFARRHCEDSFNVHGFIVRAWLRIPGGFGGLGTCRCIVGC